MEAHRGVRHGSYIWGRSVHNVRIERLWVDVTAQVGSQWAGAFTDLELHLGLDINNVHHIWLLHFLFLPTINQQLSFFAESWNHHQIQIRRGPNRSPADMFSFDMLVHGIRGSQLPPEELLSLEELEVYGVDWAALRDEQVIASVQNSVPVQQEADGSSWIGQVGPPPHLNEVSLDPPVVTLEDSQLQFFEATVGQWSAQAGPTITIQSLWVYSLALARLVYGNIF
ncbi:hypothetical protein BDZ97DRAFT_1675362 [Flammula alnicola]|nr:hypothetical protein BDZ97DRAFT_1675362 [Flammula alnicola]